MSARPRTSAMARADVAGESRAPARGAPGVVDQRGPAEPTERQYRMAWPYFHGRHGCPDTIEAAKAHPIYGRCLRALASRMHSGGMPSAHPGAAAAAARRLGRETYIPPTPAPEAAPPPRDDGALGHWSRHQPTRPAHVHRARLGAHDAKRAAANDREEPTQ